MKTKIMTLRNSYILLIGMLLALSFSNAQAQIKMGMVFKVDDESAQLTADMINRRVVMAPTHRIVTKDSQTIMVELHNPTADTLTMDLYFSDTIVKSSRVVSSESIVDTTKSQNRRKGLLQDERTDSISSILRPMSAWLKELPKSISLLPGERGKITVKVEIPKAVVVGEYVSWIVAEVQPRKRTSEVGKVVYTISTTKISYKSESNNIDTKSSR